MELGAGAESEPEFAIFCWSGSGVSFFLQKPDPKRTGVQF